MTEVSDGLYETLLTFPEDNSGINPQRSDSEYRPLIVIGSKIIFRRKTDRHGSEPWITDLTTDGTRILADIGRGRLNSDDYNPHFFKLNDKAIFVGCELQTDCEYWVTNGTPDGTKRLVDAFPGEKGSAVGDSSFSSKGKFYSLVTTGTIDQGQSYQLGIIITDGTEENTSIVTPTVNGNNILRRSGRSHLVVSGDNIYFGGYQKGVDKFDGVELHSTGLYRYKISTGVTKIVSEFTRDGCREYNQLNGYFRTTTGGDVSDLTLIGRFVLFSAVDAYGELKDYNEACNQFSKTNREMWILDAKSDQLKKLREIDNHRRGSLPEVLMPPSQ